MEDAIRKTDDMARNEAFADASTSPPEDSTEVRLQLHRNGYRPIPVLGAHVAMKGAGKRPMMKGWETVCGSADETEIARWTKAQRNCTNTGLLCGELVGVDIDVLDRDHAHRLTGIAAEMLGMSPASRIGRAPKILLAFRTDAPFDKVQTSEFHMLDGTVARVEVLATGQQFVAFGIHPDTRRPIIGRNARRSTCRCMSCRSSAGTAAWPSSPRPSITCARLAARPPPTGARSTARGARPPGSSRRKPRRAR